MGAVGIANPCRVVIGTTTRRATGFLLRRPDLLVATCSSWRPGAGAPSPFWRRAGGRSGRLCLGRRRLRGRRGDDHGCLACLLLRGAGALARLGLLGLALGRLVPLAFVFLTALLRKAGLFLGGLLEGQDAFALGRLFDTFLGLSLRHHAALDVGAALAELDAHGLGGGPRPAALDRELDLAHGLALQDDARRLLAFGTPPMALSEVRQQGALLVFGDGVAGLAVGQSGLVELRDQAIHGDPDDLGELFDRHVSHRAFLRPVAPLRPMRTTGRAPP